MEIHTSEIQPLVKHYNKKHQKYILSYLNYETLSSLLYPGICRNKTHNFVKYLNKNIFATFFFLSHILLLKKNN